MPTKITQKQTSNWSPIAIRAVLPLKQRRVVNVNKFFAALKFSIWILQVSIAACFSTA